MAAVMAIAENLRGPALGRPSAAEARRYWLQARRSQLTPYLFIAPNMALFSVFVFFPLLYAFYISLREWSLIDTPRYIGLQRDEIPAIPTPDGRGTVNLVSGEYLGRKGAMEPLLDIFMSTVELGAGSRVEFPGVAKRNVFLYVVRGAIKVAGQAAPEWHLIELGDAVTRSGGSQLPPCAD